MFAILKSHCKDSEKSGAFEIGLGMSMNTIEYSNSNSMETRKFQVFLQELIVIRIHISA